MTASPYLLTLGSLAMAWACIALLVASYRATGELLTPWTMFLGMALLDFYLPGALFLPVGLALPPWLSPSARDVTLEALLLFTAGAVFFAAGYAQASRRSVVRAMPIEPYMRRVAIVAAIVALAFLWSLGSEVLGAGGGRDYLAERLTNRFARSAGVSGLTSLLLGLRGILLSVLFVLAGIAFTKRHAHPVLGFGMPALAALAASTMLLRGFLLTLLFGLAVLERSRLHDLESVDSADGRRQAHRMNLRIVCMCALGILLFASYGTVRNYLTEEAYSGRATLAQAAAVEMSRFVRGEGFVGLIGVIDGYPRDVPFMKGRTVRDMLLLPIPRALWTSKPDWYGIDDITRSMGWPSSTMSAITMPGELYANFAVWGIPLMWLYGWFFGHAYTYRFHPVLRYVYAFVVVPMVLPTFWMAFTGFVNLLVPVPVLVLVLWFVFGTARGDAQYRARRFAPA